MLLIHDLSLLIKLILFAIFLFLFFFCFLSQKSPASTLILDPSLIMLLNSGRCLDWWHRLWSLVNGLWRGWTLNLMVLVANKVGCILVLLVVSGVVFSVVTDAQLGLLWQENDKLAVGVDTCICWHPQLWRKWQNDEETKIQRQIHIQCQRQNQGHVWWQENDKLGVGDSNLELICAFGDSSSSAEKLAK